MPSLQLTRRRDGVAVLTLDVPGRPVNVLSSRLIGEFRDILEEIERRQDIRACVLASGKEDSFIAGADLDEVRAMETAEEASEFVREGHSLLDSIAWSPKPFVAAIHGAALGGGLEVALACASRVATDHPKSVLALPEVMVGLMPAGGGTQRLPRLIGLRHALPMMLSGQRIRPRRALAIGLVDALVTPDDLIDAAAAVALRLASRRRRPKQTPPSIVDRIIRSVPPLRESMLRHARREVERKSRGLYPAPLAILDAVSTGLTDGFQNGREKEIELFGRLAVSPEAKNLLWLFEAMTELKKLPPEPKPLRVRKLAVLGGGLMGEGIASVSARLNPVVVRDLSDAVVARIERNFRSSLTRRSRSGSLDARRRESEEKNFRATTDLAAIEGADLVIEAVFEDLDLKRRVVAEAEKAVPRHAVIASNTSALPIADIAAGAMRRSRVVGMHYFSPVPKMPLLEVVRAEGSDEEAVVTAQAYGIEQGKTVIVVRDGPGFYTTRILAPYMNEAILLLEEGAEIAALDDALRDFGFPVGPVTLLDEVGIDVAAHVSRDLGRAFDARGISGSETLAKLHEAGFGGKKNRRGFYSWRRKGRKEVNREIYAWFGGEERKDLPPDAVDRLVFVMLNEAVHCLAEGVLASPRDGDVGAILGLGFPPFRGGPFHHLDALGIDAAVGTLQALRDRHGRRFEPAPLLAQMAATGDRFYRD